MKKLKSNKRGFTLVELCIVIALIAVAATLMTSFMAVFQTRTAQNTVRHDFLDEVALVREHMGKWVEACDTGYDMIIPSNTSANGNKIIYRSVGGTEVGRITLNNGVLVFFRDAGADDDSTMAQLNLKAIKSITLEAYEATGTDADGKPITYSSNGKLLKCTLTGVDAFGNSFSQNLIFALDGKGKFVNY